MSRSIFGTFLFWSLLIAVCADNEEEAASIGIQQHLFPVEGKLIFPDEISSRIEDGWQSRTHVLFNYGEYTTFVRRDGSFVAYMPSGSYIVEVANTDFVFEQVRVDLNSKGKVRCRRLQLLQPNAVNLQSYPLKLRATHPTKYFQVREAWRITDFLFSPMVLMMAVPLLLIAVVPKLIDTQDPETQREMRESFQMPKYEMPELSELMTSWLGGGSKPKGGAKAIKKKS